MTDDSDIKIRPATVEDVEPLVRFIQPFVANGRLLPRTNDELTVLVDNGFVAETGGKIVGFAALEIYSAKLAEIRSLAVEPECRRRGVGQDLVHACVRRAQERHILEVMAITSSEDFFRSCGFDFSLPGEKKALFFTTDP